MGSIAKAKSSGSSRSSSDGGWGMGLLFVFFPEEDATILNNNHKPRKTTNLSSSSSSSSSSPFISSFKRSTTFNNFLRRTYSTQLLSRAQSTISICGLLISITLLLFALSTFEPTSTAHFVPRRQLSPKTKTNTITITITPSTSNDDNNSNSSKSGFWSSINVLKPTNSHGSSEFKPLHSSSSHALQGMGTLYRRGTKAMNDLIVAHVTESVTVQELRLFLRLFYRSDLSSKSDLAFIFAASPPSEFSIAIREENDSFLKLIDQYKKSSNVTNLNSIFSFDVTQFVKSSKKDKDIVETIWGRRIRSNYSEEGNTESARLSYGSVLGFAVDELDPENSLAGFLDHVPMNLRRWACYPMLLGRVRRKFKHVMLVDIKDMLLIGDPLGRVRSRNPESVHLSTVTQSSPQRKHGKKNSDRTQSQQPKLVNLSIVMGGARGVRRLSSTVLTEIARSTIQHKKTNSVSESGLFNQLITKEFMLKNVDLIFSTESIPELSSLTGLNSKSDTSLSSSKFAVVRRGNSSVDSSSSIMKHFCSSSIDSFVYGDC